MGTLAFYLTVIFSADISFKHFSQLYLDNKISYIWDFMHALLRQGNIDFATVKKITPKSQLFYRAKTQDLNKKNSEF